MDGYVLSCFISSNNYPQRLEDIEIALEKEIPRLKGKGNILNAKRALLRIKEALVYIDRLPK